MEVVYKAYHEDFERWFALKFSSPSQTISSADLERFRSEAQSMARLRHPNIVTVQETLQLVRNDTPSLPRALNSKVDRDLEAICLKCLKKDRPERYVSASALAHDLERYLNGTGTVARPWTRGVGLQASLRLETPGLSCSSGGASRMR